MSLHRQRGVGTLIFSIVILSLVTTVVLYTTNALLVEKQISANEVRSRHAFEAAEAGMAQALVYLEGGIDRCNNTTGVMVPDDIVDAGIYDTNGDGCGDSLSTGLDNGSVSVVLTDNSGGDMTNFTIVSTGLSDDGSARRVITQRAGIDSALPNAPDNPLVTKGGINIGGSVDVYMQEGHTSVWTGEDIVPGGSTNTMIPNIGAANYPSCMDTPATCSTVVQTDGTATYVGMDVVENDTTLGNLTTDELFFNFFGMTPAQYRATKVTMDFASPINNGNVTNAIEQAANEIIWIDGDYTTQGGGHVGCTGPGNMNINYNFNQEAPTNGVDSCEGEGAGYSTEPSVVIINGDFTFSGGPDWFGLVFVFGDVFGSGGFSLTGAMIVGGNVESGGNFALIYNSDVLDSIADAGFTAGASGSWRDF